jgi:hypothetical protein
VRGSGKQELPRRPAIAGSCLVILAAVCFSVAVRARDLTPAEMIEAHLPAGKTLQTAKQANLLSAICQAVKQNRAAAVAIASTAVAGRAEYAGEIVEAALRCSDKVDCEFAGMIVAAAVVAAPRSVTQIHDAAIRRAPGCSETIHSAAQPLASPVATVVPAVAPVGTNSGLPGEVQQDEGYNPLEPLRLVCDNGTQRALRESQVADFVKTHPGAFPGTCPPTATAAPATVAKPAAAPSPTQQPQF